MSEEQSTAVAANGEVEAIRRAGSFAVERQRVINATTRQLAGMKWGDVAGNSLSDATRYAIAQLCSLTGANPGIHIDILGNRVYLNAAYWSQVVADQPHHVETTQHNISAEYAKELRRQARAILKEAEELEMPELRADAAALVKDAIRVDERRAHYGIPDKAAAAYETVIRRYTEGAPLAAILAGRVDGDRYVTEVREANYAGGGAKPRDPVGDARPHETARSRSLRRAAVRAYSTTLQPVERELRKLEHEIEAEFEVIATARPERLPAGRQALTAGTGEPEAADAVDAEPLPVARPKHDEVPASAKAERKRFLDGCKALGIEDVQRFIDDTLGHDAEVLSDFQTLNAALNRLAHSEPAEEQEGLGL